MANGAKFPRFSDADVADPETLRRRLNAFLTTLENRFAPIEGPLSDPRDPAAGEEVFVFENLTEDRTLDCDSTTTGEIADVLGTLITDLYNDGKLR